MTEENNILVFGASVTFGACDDEEGGWAVRLGKFTAKKTGWDVLVYNLGVSGEGSDDVLKRFESECSENRGPGIVIFSLGSNDAYYVNEPGNLKVPPEQFRENLAKLIGMARKRVEKVLILTPAPADESKTMPVPWAPTIYYTEENIQKYAEIVREVCREKEVPLVDINRMFGKASDEFFHDGLHPNAAGHKRMFEAVKQFLEENKWI